ncbi:hypothetical protein P343_07210 [Sporolactobacillus laevolacticus DSM 442]|uniref:Uncharacterized protein n=1 Tax=Sporolactobacillus laevolacticus DSM 442 TaxID=1395513 RepID=V6IYE2_9BACL|nr:hypothetical protein P343_07210 [Sporolactobacillus laevolacticus DSM 442]
MITHVCAISLALSIFLKAVFKYNVAFFIKTKPPECETPAGLRARGDPADKCHVRGGSRIARGKRAPEAAASGKKQQQFNKAFQKGGKQQG